MQSVVDPLNGLRGIACLHVMIGHYIRDLWNLEIFEGLEMPLFFLLSGYCLTLRYGAEMANGQFSNVKFMLARVSRLLPLYWLVNLAVVLSGKRPNGFLTQDPNNEFYAHYNRFLYNYDTLVEERDSWGNYLLTFTCTQTWFSTPWKPTISPMPASTASWTVNTLLAFYLTYPFLLNKFQALEDATILKLIWMLYWIPTLIMMSILLTVDLDAFMNYYFFFTLNPVLRLYVFALGILGGIQTLRWRENNGCGIDPAQKKNALYVFFPSYSLPALETDDANNNSPNKESQKFWNGIVDILGAAWIILVILIFFFYTSVCERISPRPSFLSLLSPHWQLYIIMSISRCNDENSFLVRLCKNRIIQFFGNISMSLYLVHYNVLMFLSKLTQEVDDGTNRLPYHLLSRFQIFVGAIIVSVCTSDILLKVYVNPIVSAARKASVSRVEKE